MYTVDLMFFERSYDLNSYNMLFTWVNIVEM